MSIGDSSKSHQGGSGALLKKFYNIDTEVTFRLYMAGEEERNISARLEVFGSCVTRLDDIL